VIRGFLEARWRRRVLDLETDDAVQEVFLECLKPGGVLDRADPARGDFRGLLFGVTRNVAQRYEERALERGQVRPDDDWLRDTAADQAGQETLFDRNWARALLRLSRRRHRALALADGEAGKRRIEILERRFGDDQAIRDIAASWGVPAQEVHRAYRKARGEFYGCLRQVVAHHAAPGTDVDSECRRLLLLVR
jgi:DNA-directed RNA polymerase specialized sigma24 family protein